MAQRKNYSEEQLNGALFEIEANNMSKRRASKEFGVPRSTLKSRLSGKLLCSCKCHVQVLKWIFQWGGDQGAYL